MAGFLSAPRLRGEPARGGESGVTAAAIMNINAVICRHQTIIFISRTCDRYLEILPFKCPNVR